MQKEIFLDILAQNKATVISTLNQITTQNASWRLNEQAASVGFIYRHLGETLNRFGWFFGLPTDIENTTMGYTDSGQGQDTDVSRRMVEQGYDRLREIVETTPESGWLAPIDTPFFGTVSRARLFSHVLFHNSYHTGQIALALARSEP